jgi:hypothetical protein
MDKLIGWILENTKANWSAMLLLQKKYPKWLLRGCLAHGLHASMKDIATYKKGTGQQARDNTFGLEWADKVVMLCHKLANYIQDSGPAKAMVNKAQELEYGARRSIDVPAPTRWCSNFMVAKSVLASKQALQTTVRTQACSESFSGESLTTAQLITEMVENTRKTSRNSPQPFYFWEKVTLFVELFQPFSDAIHQVEADLPFLSQAWLMLNSLQQHVAAFIENHSNELGITGRLQETFDRRWELRTGASRAPILNAAYFAAHLLDPAFAKEDADGNMMLHQLPTELENEAKDLIRRVGGSAAGDAIETLLLNH